MHVNGTTTVEVLQQEVDNLLVVPKLFSKPKMGWIEWAETVAALIEAGQLATLPLTANEWQRYVDVVLLRVDIMAMVDDIRYSKETTVSGRLTAARAPRWFYGMLLPVILSGDFEAHCLTVGQKADKKLVAQIQAAQSLADLDALEEAVNGLPTSQQTIPIKRAFLAKQSRLHFENGRPLYIGEIDHTERYIMLRPVLVYHGDGRYTVGHGQWKRSLQAKRHIEAIHDARQWMLAQRQREIDMVLDKARERTNRTPRLVADLLLAILRQHELLQDAEAGLPLAWMNGSHNHFGFQGPDFCYMTRCAPQTAVRMAQLAVFKARQQGDSEARIQVDVSGQVAHYLRLDNVREGDDEMRWDGGGFNLWRKLSLEGTAEKGLVYADNGQAAFITTIMSVNGQAGQVFSHQARAHVDDRNELAASFVPGDWQLTTGDIRAWCVYAGVNALRQRQHS